MRTAAKCTFHCSGVREPELLPQELHSGNVSLKGKEGPHQPTITSSAKTPSEEEFDLADGRKAHGSHEQLLHWWNCLLEQSHPQLFCSRPKQNILAKIIYHQQSRRRQVPGRIQAHEMVHSVLKLLSC